MTQTTTDHHTIRQWVEAKGGKPAAVERTHHGEEDIGIIRLMFPKSPQSEHSNLVEITWDEFFEKFEASNLALIFEEDTLFNKLVGRDTAEHREHGEHSSRHHPAPAKHAEGHKAAPSEQGPPKHDKAKHETGKHETGKHEPAKHEGAGSADFKAREYRDADGTVHHHTKAYTQSHGGKT